MIETRYLAVLAWAAICVVAYAVVLRRRILAYRAHRRDGRSSREVIGTLALFLTALSSLAGTLFWLFWPDVAAGRAFGFGLSMASFAAAGVVLASEPGVNRLGNR